MIVYLSTARWNSGPVVVAAGFWARWRGLRPRPRGRGLLLTGGTVHGRGMVEPLTVVGLDSRGRILEVACLRPGRFLRMRAAVAVLELPQDRPLPPVGAIVEVVRAAT